MKVTLLGSGTSTGIPRIGDEWGQCDPQEPRNRRTRVSVVIENNAGQRVLIDTSTDMRQQMLREKIAKVDAVLWTHDHADHCHGIDDLRVMRFGRSNAIPGFASKHTCQRLRRRFDYIFEGQFGYPTIVDLKPVEDCRLLAGFSVDSVEMPHGPVPCTGYRLEADGKAIVYATDFSAITDAMLRCFKGSHVLVVDCLSRKPHPTHSHLAMAIELGQKIKARTTVLTHLDKSMDYATLSAEVPAGVLVGYDGLQVIA